jgi:hypothetical protein
MGCLLLVLTIVDPILARLEVLKVMKISDSHCRQHGLLFEHHKHLNSSKTAMTVVKTVHCKHAFCTMCVH